MLGQPGRAAFAAAYRAALRPKGWRQGISGAVEALDVLAIGLVH
jgi:hypothetical protein